MKKLVLAGGSGFLGSLLATHFKNSFDDIVVLARKAKPPHQNIRFVIWDGQSLGAWQAELNNADVLINLTGKNVNCRYTQKNKNEILASRLDSTRVLGRPFMQQIIPRTFGFNALLPPSTSTPSNPTTKTATRLATTSQ